MHKLTDRYKFIKFILVGFLNTIFGYSTFALLIYINLHYTLAVLIATIAGILFNFKTTGKFVFNQTSNRLIFRFVGGYILTYFLNIIALAILNTLELNMYIAGLLLLPPMALFSYMYQSRYVFREDSANAICRHSKPLL